jgi:predicted ABC-type ATPase
MAKAKLRIDVVGGPNGCGKTTLAQGLFVQLGVNPNFINPDMIALGLSQADFEKASFQAGRVLLGQIDENIRTQRSFSFESTLSGRTYIRILQKAKKQGFSVSIIFVYVRTKEKSLERIARRVRDGGHNIPKESVIRRFPRTFENFWKDYRLLANEWSIVDNSNVTPKTIMTSQQYSALINGQRNEFEKLFLRMKPHEFK